MRPKRYPYQKNKLIIQSKNAKTKIELDSGKITINAEEINVGDLANEISKVQLANKEIAETIGQDKKSTETVDSRISRLESVVDEIEREIACIYGIIL
ncbi:phage protein [Streptococcus dysgalactiae]|uniref:hypothetical protein n=1 Tax=Streptococcus dysgalactiae TaxID=1334 RepID=UPI000DA033F1|nr:hypothetical protein [Streptococcus dysgalactiae]HEP1637330.1 hypothetical protein [Streptococcus pyogenes]SQB38682.1 phage protein [Streptococcus dysgalactiae]SQB66553.1 phage protein [Streptococcus dysgalactiae]GET71727.1 hypothetical protein KNZ04_02170 [Streptococcus dysgalactiae subsp. equisimilis]HEQ1553420.1 hypothetical protein [Streptococcus pyogenes]